MSPPCIVHLMRHGAPEGAGRMIGHGDPPATPAGIAACLAAAAGLSPVAIATSDLRRARACAEAIALNYPPLQGEGDHAQHDGGLSPVVRLPCLSNRDTPPSGLRPATSPCRGGIDDRSPPPTPVPGGGRGPVGKAVECFHGASPNWAPASAGEERLVRPVEPFTRGSDAGSPPALTIDPRWRELDFGAWDGQHPRDLDAEALARFWADPDAAPPPGGERWSALVARVGAAIPVLADGTLVVTHAGAIRAALAVLCGFDAWQAWALALPYAAVVTLHIWPGESPTAQIVRLA